MGKLPLALTGALRLPLQLPRSAWHSGFATHTRLGSLPPDPTMLTHRLCCVFWVSCHLQELGGDFSFCISPRKVRADTLTFAKQSAAAYAEGVTQTIRSIVGFGVKTPKKSLFEVFGLCVYRLFVQSVPVWFTSFCLPLSCALFSLFARVAV